MPGNVSSIVAALLVLSLFTEGCATIVHSPHQDLPITTMPPDVIARVDDKSCVTPCTLRVSRRAEKIHFAAEGSSGISYPLFKSVNAYSFYLGNILLLLPAAFIGAAIDYQTGAKDTIKPVDIVLPHANRK